MQYQFSVVEDCLKAELSGRESVAETAAFLRAAAEEAQKARLPRILISVKRSRPIFKLEQYRITEHLKQLAANREVRVALIADSDELRAAHQTIEVLARQHGANVRAFREETEALAWLRAGELQSQEKR